MRDNAFIDEATKLRIAVDPMSGERVSAIVNETINVPTDIVAKAIAASKRQEVRN